MAAANTAQTQASENALERLFTIKGAVTQENKEKRLESHTDAHKPIFEIIGGKQTEKQTEAIRKTHLDEAIEEINAQQQAIRLAEELEREICIDLREGKDLQSIFLKAVEALGLATDNGAFIVIANEELRKRQQ